MTFWLDIDGFQGFPAKTNEGNLDWSPSTSLPKLTHQKDFYVPERDSLKGKQRAWFFSGSFHFSFPEKDTYAPVVSITPKTMGPNQWYHFGVGAPPIFVYVRGWIRMFTGSTIWILKSPWPGEPSGATGTRARKCAPVLQKRSQAPRCSE